MAGTFVEGGVTVTIHQPPEQVTFRCTSDTLDLMIMKFLPGSPTSLIEAIAKHTCAVDLGRVKPDEYFNVSTSLIILGHYWDQRQHMGADRAWRD